MSENKNKSLLDDAKDLGINLSFDDLDQDQTDDDNTPEIQTKKITSSIKTAGHAENADELNNDLNNLDFDDDYESTKSNNIEVSATTKPKNIQVENVNDDNNLLNQLTDDMSSSEIKAQINLKIIDDNANTSEKKVLTGSVGDNANVNIVLAKWLNNGYKLANNDLKLDKIRFKNNPQTFTIDLKHKTKPVERKKEVVETIEYSSTDNLIDLPNHVTHLTFIQKGEQDIVNNHIYWDSKPLFQSFKAVKTPVVQGYKPDSDKINEVGIEITNDTWNNDFNVKRIVNYSPEKQNIIINYVDQTTGKTVHKTLHGYTNEVEKYSTKNVINKFLQQGGFTLVKDETANQTLKYNNQTGTDQIYNVYLKHIIKTLTKDNPIYKGTNYLDKLTKVVSRKIIFTFSNGSEKQEETHPPVIQKVVFTRKGYYDTATKQVAFDDWKNETKNIPSFKTPVIAGYQTETDTLSSEPVTKDSDNLEEYVTYTPRQKTIKVILIDKSLHRELATKEVKGESDAKLEFKWRSNANALRKIGYYIDDHSFDAVKDVYYDPKQNDQTVKLYFEHEQKKITLNSPISPKDDSDYTSRLEHTVTRTIQYHLPKTLTNFPDNTNIDQSIQFTREAMIDMVLGKAKFSEWSDEQELPKIDVPQIKGFTSNIKTIPAKKVNAHSSDSHVDVQYTAKTQTIKLVVYDKTDDKIIGTRELTGKTNEPIKVSNERVEKLYTDKGFEIISNEFAGVSMFKPNDKPVECKLVVEHGYKTLDITDPFNTLTNKNMIDHLKSTRRFIVKYVFRDGKTAAQSNEQNMHLTRTGRLDLTNGQIKYSDWIIENELNDAISPNVQGYVPDKDLVSAPELLGENNQANNSIQTVTYYIEKQVVVLQFLDQNKNSVKEDKIELNIHDKEPISINKYLKEVEEMGYGINIKTGYPQQLIYDKTKPNVISYIINVHETFLNTDETKNIARHITIKQPNDTVEEIVQVVHLKRTITTSNVTGKKSIGEWSNGTWWMIPVPKIAGYEANMKIVPEIKITAETNNTNVSIQYKKQETPHVQHRPITDNIEQTQTEARENDALLNVDNLDDGKVKSDEYTEEKPKIGFWHRIFGSFHKNKDDDIDNEIKALPEPKKVRKIKKIEKK